MSPQASAAATIASGMTVSPAAWWATRSLSLTAAARPSARLGVVTLDRAGDHGRQAPAAGEDAADDGVVHAELAALDLRAGLRGRLAIGEDLLVAGIEADQDELADVVQQRRGGELVATGDVGEAGEALGRVPVATAWRRKRSGRLAHEVEGCSSS